MRVALKKLSVPDETVQLIREGMKAKMGLDGSLLEQFDVIILRQGCCMALVLQSVHLSGGGGWQVRVEGAGGVGMKLNYKYDQKLLGGTLFWRYIKKAYAAQCLFADDGVLLPCLQDLAQRGNERVPKNVQISA